MDDHFEQIVSLSKLLIAAASGTTVSVFGVIKFFDYQKTRIQEKSVGSTAVAKLQACMDSLANRFNVFEEKFRSQEKKIDELHDDNQGLKSSNDELMRTILTWIKK